GANPDDPVMLVGHSQGGIVAADAANHFTASKEYNVTHVVTAGSPVGRIPVPDGVQVLSLENQHDLVPHLDATANPDQPNRTTVTFDSQHGTVGDNHGIGSAYQPAATALDSSTHPSVVNFKNTAQPFLAAPGGGTQVTTHQFEVSRS
ncbi:MAG TPA: hypothetical protein VF755_02895, partial [Catenuloplanes sp.]